MKTHKLIEGMTEYPIGENIVANMPVIANMGKVLKEFIAKNYPKTSHINLLCKGSSGAIIAGLVSVALRKNKKRGISIFHIKKLGEKAHGSGSFDEDIFDLNSIVVIIDDFIDTGSTIKSILLRVDEVHPATKAKIHILCVTGNGILSSIVKRRFVHAIISK